MEDKDYRIITFANTTIKCFRDGRIFTISKKCKKYDKWIERTNNPTTNGYIRIRIGGKSYYIHRLIMIAFVGESDKSVDHINRIRNDNRFENLRYCNYSENALNTDRSDNAKGYYWDKVNKKWKAYIRINNKLKHLGCFDKEEDARQAYVDAKLKYSNEL
jgi:hypothetical protein